MNEEKIKEQIASLEDIIDKKCKGKITLNEAETAKILGVGPGTLSNWRKDGFGIPYIKIGNNGSRGRVLYPKREIAIWLLQRTLKTA